MKSILTFFIFLGLSAQAGYGQEVVNNFQIQNRELIWQKVVETKLTFKQVVDKIRDFGHLKDLVLTDNKLTAAFYRMKGDYIGAGYSERSTPYDFFRSHITGYLIVEFKESRYRITVKNIVFKQKEEDILKKQGELTDLEEIALASSRKEMVSEFEKKTSVILDYTFSRNFEFVDDSSATDW